MNLGLPEKLQLAFPDVVTVERPLVIDKKIQDPNWLAGFTSGEGSFIVIITANRTCSTGFQVVLVFHVSQHVRDEKLMRSFIIYLGCGKTYTRGEGF